MTLYDLNPVSSFWSTAQELGFMNSPLEGYKSVIHKLILNNVLRMGEGLKSHEVFWPEIQGVTRAVFSQVS